MVVVEEREGQFMSGRLSHSGGQVSCCLTRCERLKRKSLEKCEVGIGEGHKHNKRGEEEKTPSLQ